MASMARDSRPLAICFSGSCPLGNSNACCGRHLGSNGLFYFFHELAHDHPSNGQLTARYQHARTGMKSRDNLRLAWMFVLTAIQRASFAMPVVFPE